MKIVSQSDHEKVAFRANVDKKWQFIQMIKNAILKHKNNILYGINTNLQNKPGNIVIQWIKNWNAQAKWLRD